MQIIELTQQILELAKNKPRIIIGIAGPPASGKSTLADALSEHIDGSIVVPMDGFHLSNDVLVQQDILHRKGAHFTFDAQGFVQLVQALRNIENSLDIPEFDRSQDNVVFKGLNVNSDNRIILVEGNYLLLDEQPWSELKSLFDLSICISPELDEIRQRLLKRWLDHGYSEHDALRKVQSNDLLNAEYILKNSKAADISISS